MWIGVLVTVFAAVALAGALVFVDRAELTAITAEAFRGRLVLLRIERELTLSADRLDALALLQLVSGDRHDELAAAEKAFVGAVERNSAALEQFQSRGHRHPQGGGAAALRTALTAFQQAENPLGTATDDLRTSDRFYEALDWVAIPSPEGRWFAVVDFVYDIQIAASYPMSTSSEYTARYWDVRRPSGAPAEEPGLESRAAYLRSLDHVSGDGTATKWSLDQVVDHERAAHYGLGLPAVVDELLEAPEAAIVRDAVPFLLNRTDRPTLPPTVMFERMSDYTERARIAADRAIVLVDRHIAAEAERAEREALAARVIALVAILLFAGVLTVVELRRRRFNLRLLALAETDSLTSLGNRYSLQVYETARLSDPNHGGFALMHLDLDNFKAINDSFGHQVGDRALVAFAELCRRTVPAGATVARIGGDEFVIVLHDLSSPAEEAREVARRVHEALGVPIDCGGRKLRLQASIGIATAGEPAQLDEMMVEADLALYAAKERGSNQREIFGDLLRRVLVQELPTVLANGTLDCAFQPQVHLRNGDVVGVEALARWPGRSVDEVPPRKVIDVIEWLGETPALLRAMMLRVGEAYAATGHLFAGRFWLNLSPADLAVSGATETLLAMLDSTSVPLDRLGVEVTESLPIVDFELAVDVLGRLRDAGVAIAIDDFGSGNTPLRHLTTLPLDLVKLDRSVTVGVDSDPANHILARAVRFICESHGMDLLCEGVETDREVDVLLQLGIDRGQGYAFARPMALAELTEYLRSKLPDQIELSS